MKYESIAKAAKQAEEQGFDTFGYPEVQADPFTSLAPAVMATERIHLMTMIAVAFPRSPMVTAEMSWGLHANSQGRFVLGLGSQVKAHNQRRFSTPWMKPRTRMREYVESVHAIWRCWEKGEKLQYEGELYQFSLMTPEFSPPAQDLPRPPVYVAAVKDGMQQAVASYADGILLHGFCTKKYQEQVTMPAIEAGLREGGRDRATFDVEGGGFIVTGATDEEIQKQREGIRYRVAFYGSTPAYRPVLSLHGWDDLGEKLHGMSRRGEWRKMAAEVPDDVLDHFCVAATYDDLPRAVEERFGGLSDSVEIALPRVPVDAARDILGKIQAIKTQFTGHEEGW